MSNSMKVSFCCKDCKRRMFDYYAGNLNLSIKCNRCKRVLTLKKIDEKYVAEEGFRDIRLLYLQIDVECLGITA